MRHKIFILFLFVILSACGNSAANVFNNLDDNEIYIGVIYPVSLRDQDTYLREGIEFAVERINAEGGVLGRNLRTIIRDDENDAHLAMQIANTMYEHGITAVIGHWSTNICYFLTDVYQENEVVMITPAATGTHLFGSDSRFTYRMGANNDIYAAAIAEHIAESGLSRIAILYSDDQYGNDFALYIERSLNRHNILVIDRVTSISPASINAIMERWNAFGCDGVVVAALMPAIVEPIQLIRRADNDIPIFGFDNFDRADFPVLLEGYSNNIYKAAFDLNTLETDFLETFQTLYGHNFDIRAMTGYAAVRLIADAMEASGTIESNAIADFLMGLDSHPTIFGPLSYNSISREFEYFNLTVIEAGAWHETTKRN